MVNELEKIKSLMFERLCNRVFKIAKQNSFIIKHYLLIFRIRNTSCEYTKHQLCKSVYTSNIVFLIFVISETLQFKQSTRR